VGEISNNKGYEAESNAVNKIFQNKSIANEKGKTMFSEQKHSKAKNKNHKQ